jgi:hypothetical protein
MRRGKVRASNGLAWAKTQNARRRSLQRRVTSSRKKRTFLARRIMKIGEEDASAASARIAADEDGL